MFCILDNSVADEGAVVGVVGVDAGGEEATEEDKGDDERCFWGERDDARCSPITLLLSLLLALLLSLVLKLTESLDFFLLV